jgi:hypothetical protein
MSVDFTLSQDWRMIVNAVRCLVLDRSGPSPRLRSVAGEHLGDHFVADVRVMVADVAGRTVAEALAPEDLRDAVEAPHRAGRTESLYLVTRSLEPTGTGRTTGRCGGTRSQCFAITFGDQFPAAETY